MRRAPGEWARLSTLACLLALGALVALSSVLLLVHGLVWPDGIEDPSWFHQMLLVALAVPFLAVPGLVVARMAGGRGWRLAVVAVASAAFGLGADLLGVASPVSLWAGMVTGTLLGVVWLPMGGAPDPDATPGTGTPPAVTGRAQTYAAGAGRVAAGPPRGLVEPPQPRRVPRDVLAPPEGWEVPETLPPRPSRPQRTLG